MNDAPSHLWHAFWRILLPTAIQSLIALVLAAALIIGLQSQNLLKALGISSAAVDATSQQFSERFGVVLQSPVTSKLVLLTFWAGIGLVVYLICWGMYNVLISARNEVTIQTQYTNRSAWSGPWGALIIKGLSALLLLVYLSTFSYGLSTWLSLSAPVFHQPSLETGLMVVAAILGLAVQLYIFLVILQLLFTPWYTKSPFTEDAE